jgi:hypothetical protein
MDGEAETSRGTVAIAYAELAQRLGIDPGAARRCAQRLHWPETRDGDGEARVHVPAAVVSLEAGTAVPAGVGAEAHPAAGPGEEGLLPHLLRLVERAEERAQALEAALSIERERAARTEGEAQALRDALAHERARMAEETEARIRADAELAAWTAGGPLARALRAFLARPVMTEDEARAALRAWDSVDGAEAWIAAQPWKAVPGGWTVATENRDWRFRVELTPEGLRVIASSPGGGQPSMWTVRAR